MDIPQYKLPKFGRTFEEVVRTHCFIVDPEITPADLLNPMLWEHMAERFKLGEEVVVKASDFSYRFHGEIVAIDLAGHWAALRQISLAEGLPFVADVPDKSGFSHNHDPVMGWRVMNGKDVVASKLPNEAAAIARKEELKRAAGMTKKVA